MGGAIAYCETCLCTFEDTKLIAVSDSSNVKIIGCTTICPNGHKAKIIDGIYDFEGDTLSAVRALNPTQQKALSNILKNISQQPEVSQEALDDIIKVAPELGVILQNIRNKNFPMAAILIFIFLCISKCQGTELNIHIGDKLEYHQIINRKQVAIEPKCPSANDDSSSKLDKT